MNHFELENDHQAKLESCVFSSKLSSDITPVSLLKSNMSTLKSETKIKSKLSLLKASMLVLLAASAFVSVNAQAQWTKMFLPPAATNVQSFSIDPTNSNNMLAGTSCLSPIFIGGVSQCGTATGLYRSTNAGLSWIQVNDINLKNGINSISYSSENLTTKNIYVSVEGKGVFRSSNGGVSWVAAHIRSPVITNDIITKKISQIIVTNKIGLNQTVYALVGSSDNNQGDGGIYATIDNGVTWKQIYIGDDIKKLVVAKSAPTTIYVSTTLGEIRKATNVNLSGFSTNVNFTSVTSGLPSVVVDFMIDPVNSNYLYASAFGSGVNGFYRTINGGSSWQSESTQYVFSKIAVDSKVSPAKYYGADDVSVGGTVAKIHVLSSNNRMTWLKSDINHLGFNSQQMNVLVANNGVVYAGVDGGLYKNIESVGNGTGNGTGNTTALNVRLTAQATFSTTAGGDINYTLTLQNTSTTTDAGAFTVTSSTVLPFGTVKVSDSPFNSCSLDTSRRVSCNVTGLTRGLSKTISLRVRLPSTLSQTQVAMTFSANVTGDSNTFDNLNKSTSTTISGVGGVNNGGINATVPIVTSNARTVIAGSVVGTYSFSATPVTNTDQLTYTIVSGGTGIASSLGTVLFSNPSVGAGSVRESLSPSFTFRPKANVSGREIIRFKVRDSSGRESLTGNYIFTVTLPGGSPSAGNSNAGSASNSGGAVSPFMLGLLGLLFFARRFK